MKLPLSFPKKEKKEYFLTLILRNEKVNAIFFEEIDGKVNVLSKHAENFPTSIEEASVEELLEITDKAISTAEQSLTHTLEKVKTIFGVKGSWVDESKINPEKLAKLKKISDELGLIPIGFLVIFEAIAFLLEKEEGAPVTTILAETGKKYISAALIKAGKIKEFKASEITESPAVTLDNILKHFTSAEVLPPRIIIFNGQEDESQQFINHTWSKSLPFLHLPQVTTLPAEFDGRAVLYGAATQLGFSVLDEKPMLSDDSIPDLQDESESKPSKVNTADQIGNIKTVSSEESLEHFGFVQDKDAAKEPPPILEEAPPAQSEGIREVIEEIPEEIKMNEGDKRSLPMNASAILSGGKIIISSLPKLIGKFNLKNIMSLSSILSSKGKIIFVPIVLIVLLAVLGYFYFFANKATVIINVEAKSAEQSQDVTFASGEPTDPAGGVIASEFIAVTEEGVVSKKTSGKKEVGTNSKGTVTIFNNNSSPQKLSSGTTISSSNGLDFTLDKDMTVASASGDVFSGTTPGKANADITAKKIGQEYNLPSNTKFTVGNSSSIAAKNDEAFSGGTKKEVTVVSADDISKLRSELPKSLEAKAKENLTNKISDDQVLLSVLISREIVKEDFSKKKDDEANEIKLTGTVEFRGIAYRKSDSVSYANEVLKKNISEDTTIDPDSLEINVDKIEQDGDNVDAKISIKGFTVPKIDNNDVAKQISGKSFENAQDLIKKYPQVSGAEIKLSFSLPFLPTILPFSSKNIEISTKVNE